MRYKPVRALITLLPDQGTMGNTRCQTPSTKGVLTEVPVMFALVKNANKSKEKFRYDN